MASPELRAVRAVLRGRRDRADASEVSYRIYLAVMLVIIVGAPLVRGLVLWMLEALPVPGTTPSEALAAVLTGLTALCVLAGAQGGPARTGLPQLDLLHTSAIPRRRLLAAPVARALALGAGLGMFVAGIVVATRLLRADLDPALAVALLLGGAGLGVLAAFGMLLGQVGRGVRWGVAGALAGLAALQLAGWVGDADGGGLAGPVDPWSWVAGLVFAAADPGRSAPVLLLAGLLAVVAMILAMLAPRMAARLRWEALREQAARWDAIGISAMSGDPKAALARLGAPVRVGRRLRVRPTAHLTLTLLSRDLLGVIRTPARSLLALIGVTAAAAIWGIAVGGGAGAAAGTDPDLLVVGTLGAVAVLLAYAALQPWCRGLATAADGAGSPGLLPATPQGLLLRHLQLPLLLGLLAAALGGGALVVSGWGAAPTAVAPVSAGALVGTALALRVLSSLKGTIPMRLLAPVPTPVGDASGINVLLWTLDGSIAAALLGALLAVVWALGIAAGGVPVAALITSAAVLAGVLLWARVRLAS
ncbi:hypothetical protein MUN76_04040 [Leucobacter rhizosphaerae]|uniref:ABC-2 type transport system permease protein n=1 Tax=Leucobacter rhizosphaerae TaxID=2932245 RepID=A0ABY4FXZ8_9MICO|nr:hypothetical protein [Leucobacter rhizosphaerae]UOQ61150.1 hypothetical protein MUN76_04040 [Leucobacter rhizosphaerae]